MTAKNVVFIKVHKCSSTSVRVIMEEYTKKKGLKHIERNREKQKQLRNKRGLLAWSRSTDGDNNSAWYLDAALYNISLDHHAYDPSFFEKFIKDPIYVTFLRDPLDRAISAFYSPDVPPHGQKLEFKKWYKTNVDFLNTKPQVNSCCVLTNNFMSYMLGYDLLDEITVENLEKRYAFVGLTEHFDESIKSMANNLGWDLSSRRPNIRKNPGKPEIELPQDFIDTFQQNNKLDYKLYETAKQIFEKNKGHNLG